tara:strand:+ start:5254 stop:5370 length:117 start_codon:yes stop_codon:yes gene_type:complete
MGFADALVRYRVHATVGTAVNNMSATVLGYVEGWAGRD